MQLLVANHITNNGGTEYQKTWILSEYMRDTSTVELETADEVFQMERTLEYIPRYSNNTTDL